MTELSAPYRFVPLSRFILRPDWAAHVSHDHPFADGVCGELSLTLTAHTPLCVGGKQRAATKEAPGLVHFYCTPDGVPAIPGSSLKGMLRAVMEIACFGHFQQVDDQRLGVRDISRGNNFYSQAMNRMQVHVGWLNFTAGEWRLTPCSYVRLHQQELINCFKLDKETWKKRNAPEERYRLLGGLRSVSFNTQPYPYDCKLEATDLGQGEHQGTVVVTGQPGPAFDRPKAKQREFVFYNERHDSPLVVAPEVMQGFLSIHAESQEWQYWKEQLGRADKAFPGVPVFYHQDARGVISLGLSRMYKLPYTHSLHDAIGHTQPEHVRAERPDLAGLVFGWLNEQDATHNLRGRVMPGVLTAQGTPALSKAGPVVLSSPKPTFYPAYVHQPRAEGAYKTLMDKDAELAGWKRYPVREAAQPPELTDKVKQNKKVQTYLETVAKGTAFTGKLRFHNLRLVELGALLWCIDFGRREACRHALGLGKPLGFGQAGLEVSDAQLTHNDRSHATVDSASLMEAARTAFEDYMERAWQKATAGGEKGNGSLRWEESPQVAHLLTMADPASARHEKLHAYPEPKDFMEAKRSEARFAPYAGNFPAVDIQGELAAPDGGVSDLASLLALAEQRQAEQERACAEQEAREKREQEKAAMTPEQATVAEIEDRLKADELNKTQLDKLAKDLLALEKMGHDWSAVEREKICQLGKQALALGDEQGKPKLQKAAKKVIKTFCPEEPT